MLQLSSWLDLTEYARWIATSLACMVTCHYLLQVSTMHNKLARLCCSQRAEGCCMYSMLRLTTNNQTIKHTHTSFQWSPLVWGLLWLAPIRTEMMATMLARMSTTHGFTILHHSLHTCVYMVNVVIEPFQVRVVVMFFPRKFQCVWLVGWLQPYRICGPWPLCTYMYM